MAIDPERRAEPTLSAALPLPRDNGSAEAGRAIDRSGTPGRADASARAPVAAQGPAPGPAAPLAGHPGRDGAPRRAPTPAPAPAGEPPFRGQSQREAVEAIRHALAEQHVFVALTGEAGLGKTAALDAALAASPDRPFRTVRVGEPDRVSAGLAAELEQVALERAAGPPDGHRHTVFVVDDAHTASPELLRCLARIAAAGRLDPRSPQVVLAGRPELWDRLAAEEFAPLARRIAVRPVLRPLSDEDARGYIAHLLDRPRRVPGQTLTPEAEREVLRFARGRPDRIEAVVEGALALGDARVRHPPVALGAVRGVAAALEGCRRERGRRRAGVRALAWVAVAVLAAAAGGSVLAGRHGWTPERVLAAVLDFTKPAR